MLYRIFFAAIAFNFASVTFGQSPIDNFEFPVLDSAQQTPSDKVINSDEPLDATRESLLPNVSSVSPATGEVSDEEQLTSLRANEPKLPTPTSHPVTNPMSVPSASNVAQHSTAAFSGYMALSPSAPSPLLSYMQCQQNSCPDVWAGFAYQHQRDMAAYCSMKGTRCSCGHHHGGSLYAEPCTVCQGASHHHVRNRYVAQPAVECDSCTTR